MNRFTRVVLAAALSFTSTTFAQESVPSTADTRHMIARADGKGVAAEMAVDSALLDEYAGRYEAESGVAFIIVRQRDFLTIELPESWGLAELRLRAKGTRDFFVAEVPLSISFQTDGNGHVNGLVMRSPREQQAIPAARMAIRHGIVTIHDVYEDGASVKIAASN